MSLSTNLGRKELLESLNRETHFVYHIYWPSWKDTVCHFPRIIFMNYSSSRKKTCNIDIDRKHYFSFIYNLFIPYKLTRCQMLCLISFILIIYSFENLLNTHLSHIIHGFVNAHVNAHVNVCMYLHIKKYHFLKIE